MGIEAEARIQGLLNFPDFFMFKGILDGHQPAIPRAMLVTDNPVICDYKSGYNLSKQIS